MTKKTKCTKLMVLGVDGLDPSLTRKFVDAGLMPNVQQFIAKGATRADLALLGCVPTITPPMWTTLATGAYPATHGITCFWNQDPERLDGMVYALDSHSCKAEQYWNVTTEAGLKTLVWHWPGSSWPPSSDSPLLHVVEGTQPGAVNMAVAALDWEKIIIADETFSKVLYKAKAANDTGAGCIISDLSTEQESNGVNMQDASTINIMLTLEDGEMSTTETLTFDVCNSPIKAPEKWSFALPAGAKEFSIVIGNGFIRKPALLLCNSDGIYDQVAIYRSKDDPQPEATLLDGVMAYDLIQELPSANGLHPTNRNANILEIAPDGSHVKIFMSAAMDQTVDFLFSPQTLYSQVINDVGYVPPVAMVGGYSPQVIEKAILPSWAHYTDWQASALNYLIDTNDYQVVFSHIHNVDCMGHLFMRLLKERDDLHQNEAQYQDFFAALYQDTDKYLGRFLHYLDEGWTIIITSDHGLVCTEYDDTALFGDPFGVNATVLMELGYTVLKKDADGQLLKEIDWTKTRAVATRGNHIWINLKGRNATGIVDPADKYQLEKQLINDLYSYRDQTGERIVNIVIRRKDAALLGLNGEGCGDLIYFVEEGHNRIHGDSLSTTHGYFDTSVAPIFIAAGAGLKQGYTTSRVIRQVDVAPTMAALLGTRMPAECEGAPVYQILAD